MLSPAENSRIQGFLSDFQVLFKAGLIFKDFSRKPSTFQACANPAIVVKLSRLQIIIIDPNIDNFWFPVWMLNLTVKNCSFMSE